MPFLVIVLDTQIQRSRFGATAGSNLLLDRIWWIFWLLPFLKKGRKAPQCNKLRPSWIGFTFNGINIARGKNPAAAEVNYELWLGHCWWATHLASARRADWIFALSSGKGERHPANPWPRPGISRCSDGKWGIHKQWKQLHIHIPSRQGRPVYPV